MVVEAMWGEWCNEMSSSDGTVHLYDGDLGNKATMFTIFMQYNIRIHDTEYRGRCGDALACGVFGMATRASWSLTAGEARPPHVVFLW